MVKKILLPLFLGSSTLIGCFHFDPIISIPQQTTSNLIISVSTKGYYISEVPDSAKQSYSIMWLYDNGVLERHGREGRFDGGLDRIEYLDSKTANEYYYKRNPICWGTWQPAGDSLIVYTHKLGGGGRVPTSTAVAWGGQVQGDTIILSRMEGKRKKAIRIEEKWIFHPSDWKPDSVNYVIRNSE